MERKREQIPVLGINTSASGHIVKDGACEDIFNMRYKNGALQNIFQPELIEPITNYNGFDIVHRMESMPQGHYIAKRYTLVVSRYLTTLSIVHIVGGVVEAVNGDDPFASSLTRDYTRFSSFGNALYASNHSGQYLEEECYIYKDGTFELFDIANLDPPEFDIKCERKYAANIEMEVNVPVLESSELGLKNDLRYEFYVDYLNAGGYFVGACIIMAAYIMFDGSIVKPTTPEIISSYDDDTLNDNSPKCLSRIRILTPNDMSPCTDIFYDRLYGAKLSLTLKSTIPNSHLIKGVRIFSTRINKAFVYEDIVNNIMGTLHNDGDGTISINRSLIANKDAYDINQPFYELVDILKTDPLTIDIETKKLNDIIYNPVYKPTYSLHHTVGDDKFEYNNRMHVYGLKTILFRGYYESTIYKNLYPKDDIITTTTMLVTFELNIDGKNLVINKKSKINLVKYLYGWTTYSYFVVPNLITYPDTRVTKITVKIINADLVIYEFSQSAKQATGNNFSYIYLYDYKQTENVSNVVYLKLKTEGVAYTPLLEKPVTIYQSNKLQVSAQNNPFYISADNIYTIGENSQTINAINTATEQVSETKFGLYPLYVFTDGAIYAMEVGQDEVLYSSVIGVSNLRKLPATTTAGAANYVFFVSDQGVMAIEGRKTFCISSPLDNNPELLSKDFDAYISQAQLDYNPKYDELIAYNPKYDYAYIYSLEHRVWTRRTWDNGAKLSNSQVIRTDGIYSLRGEDENKPYPNVAIVTRALKLGSLEYKRVESVLLRLFDGPKTSYDATIEGSNNLREWHSLIKVRDTNILRRTMASYIYHRIKINAAVTDYFSFTHFDVEFYNRFVRRLR